MVPKSTPLGTLLVRVPKEARIWNDKRVLVYRGAGFRDDLFQAEIPGSDFIKKKYIWLDGFYRSAYMVADRKIKLPPNYKKAKKIVDGGIDDEWLDKFDRRHRLKFSSPTPDEEPKKIELEVEIELEPELVTFDELQREFYGLCKSKHGVENLIRGIFYNPYPGFAQSNYYLIVLKKGYYIRIEQGRTTHEGPHKVELCWQAPNLEKYSLGCCQGTYHFHSETMMVKKLMRAVEKRKFFLASWMLDHTIDLSEGRRVDTDE